MPPEIMSKPEEPDDLARKAGRDIYDTPVGILRRAELWRLGNAWGFKFPVGCTKDYMLPYFKQLEADGQNPLCPPGKNLDKVVRDRKVEHSAETHAESDQDEIENPIQQPSERLERLERMLKDIHIGKLRKLCKALGIQQGYTDRKQDLIARIIDKMEEDGVDEDIIAGC